MFLERNFVSFRVTMLRSLKSWTAFLLLILCFIQIYLLEVSVGASETKGEWLTRQLETLDGIMLANVVRSWSIRFGQSSTTFNLKRICKVCKRNETVLKSSLTERNGLKYAESKSPRDRRIMFYTNLRRTLSSTFSSANGFVFVD